MLALLITGLTGRLEHGTTDERRNLDTITSPHATYVVVAGPPTLGYNDELAQSVQKRIVVQKRSHPELQTMEPGEEPLLQTSLKKCGTSTTKLKELVRKTTSTDVVAATAATRNCNCLLLRTKILPIDKHKSGHSSWCGSSP